MRRGLHGHVQPGRDGGAGLRDGEQRVRMYSARRAGTGLGVRFPAQSGSLISYGGMEAAVCFATAPGCVRTAVREVRVRLPLSPPRQTPGHH